eukprot:Gregarina_sp_Poly_1__10080@NODE_680_length_6809_cov_177_847375_g513_i0_p2_GENE_NODE_680_length_6809_cov_177_847375_g513_i0NODE_680_length_6809_cov_177_847375_g513_i0_p2_ORF_typecomplete_len372_score77_01AP2/PF00847_20/8_6e09DUF4764/PF15961_5/0_0019zfC2H2_3rep/PF18868_1/0_029zfC2H2_8/PF15909_5/0_065UPF0731/PF14982_6/1_3e03UPF0731/PF14982_6/3_7_NODE_680_length_6809_cov_177_847375_g513_i018532968
MSGTFVSETQTHEPRETASPGQLFGLAPSPQPPLSFSPLAFYMGVLHSLPSPSPIDQLVAVDATLIFAILFELDLFRATVTASETDVPGSRFLPETDVFMSVSAHDLLMQLIAAEEAPLLRNLGDVASFNIGDDEPPGSCKRPIVEGGSSSGSKMRKVDSASLTPATKAGVSPELSGSPSAAESEYSSSTPRKSPAERKTSPPGFGDEMASISQETASLQPETASRRRMRRCTAPGGLIAGVRFDSKELRWKASWSSDGRRNCRSFSVRRYGFEGARTLAVQARREAEFAGDAVRSTETLKCAECGKAFLGKRGLLTHARACSWQHPTHVSSQTPHPAYRLAQAAGKPDLFTSAEESDARNLEQAEKTTHF